MYISGLGPEYVWNIFSHSPQKTVTRENWDKLSVFNDKIFKYTPQKSRLALINLAKLVFWSMSSFTNGKGNIMSKFSLLTGLFLVGTRENILHVFWVLLAVLFSRQLAKRFPKSFLHFQHILFLIQKRNIPQKTFALALTLF